MYTVQCTVQYSCKTLNMQQVTFMVQIFPLGNRGNSHCVPLSFFFVLLCFIRFFEVSLLGPNPQSTIIPLSNKIMPRKSPPAVQSEPFIHRTIQSCKWHYTDTLDYTAPQSNRPLDISPFFWINPLHSVIFVQNLQGSRRVHTVF